MGSDRGAYAYGRQDPRTFERPVATLVHPLTNLLDGSLAGTAGLTGAERAVFARTARQALVSGLRQKLERTLLLELHAAGLAGDLAGDDERQRFDHFIELSGSAGFIRALDRRYPTLFRRVDATGRQFVTAVCAMAGRLAADRDLLADLAGGPLGALRRVDLDAGDPHRGGQRVARLDFDGGSVMYKPRPVDAEAALDGLLARLLPGPDRIRVPRVAVRDGYGWTAYVRHRPCRDDTELAGFYRNLGRWLAVMQLVGGVDLHAGNIIADGPVPVVIDAETLFARDPPGPAAGWGSAVDIAAELRERSVLRVGILPMRVGLLAGVDHSAVGGLRGEQPELTAPAVAAAGTAGARMAVRTGSFEPSEGNHPCPDPDPARFWAEIGDGFTELCGTLRRLDAAGGLDELVRPLTGTVVRRVPRSTLVYLDVGRMLWHPASLHDEATAVDRAHQVLVRHARETSGAPDEPAGVRAEIADLLVGDVPVFTAVADESLVATVLADWRAADPDRQARLIDFAAAGAYRDGVPPRPRLPVRPRRGAGDPDRTRRALAAAGIRALRDSALHGPDGTATWLGPVLGDAGWAVRPLGPDLYTGVYGVAVCLAGYLYEVRAGRADPVDGVATLLRATLATVRAMDAHAGPAPWRGLTGAGGRIWAWCALARLCDDPECLDRARARADALLLRPSEPDRADLVAGAAGLIVPLLTLAGETGDGHWLRAAAGIGDLLVQTARPDHRGAFWAATGFPDGAAGFGYGSAGCGWALGRLAASDAGDERQRATWRDLAGRAFDAVRWVRASPPDRWPAPRVHRPELATGWCHGSAGTGLAAADLYLTRGDPAYLELARACASDAAGAFGWGTTLANGDPGIWELLDTLRRIDPDAAAGTCASRVLQALRQVPARGVRAAEATAPGLFNGAAGTVFTLLRMHPDSDLCAPLLLRVGSPHTGAPPGSPTDAVAAGALP